MKPKILIVDDLIENLISLEAILEDFDIDLVRAFSGEEALKFSLKEEFALAILDVQMPGMNGIEFIKAVRLLAPLKFVPILFLTTESQQAKRAEAKAAGASGWLVKPVTADELISTVKLVVK